MLPQASSTIPQSHNLPTLHKTAKRYPSAPTASTQSIADIFLRLVKHMEDFKSIIGDGIDRDISAHTKRTITPLCKLRVWAQRMGKGERADELSLIPELSNERACSVWGG